MKQAVRCESFEIKLADILSNDFIIPGQVQLLRAGKFFHELYGEFEVTPELMLRLKENFDKNIRKIDLAIDYKHDAEDIAAGWIKGIHLLEDGQELWADVQWTPEGKRRISQKEFRYLSADFTFNYQDNESLIFHGPTLLGAGLTNRPVIKGMAPTITLSEQAKLRAENGIKDDDGANRLDQHKDSNQMNQGEQTMNELEQAKADNLKLSEQIKELEIKLGDMSKKYADMPMDPEAMMAKIKELEDLVAALKAEKEAVMAEKKLAEQSAKFDELMKSGKLCAAQKEAFMANDALKLAELAQPINLNGAGSGGAGQTQDSNEPCEIQIMKLAEAKVKDGSSKNLGEAISVVLSENEELRKKYESK